MMPTHVDSRPRGSVGIRPYARVGKRALDVVLSAAALPVAALAVVPTALAIRLEDGGPVLDVRTCLGRDRVPFPLLTLRTTALAGPVGLDPDDPGGEHLGHARRTRVGQVLRRTGLDMLPQLVSVLRGQMSLVGPSPRPTSDHVGPHPLEQHRYTVRPGMTGLAQETLHPEEGWDLRCRVDAFYAEEHRLGIDMWVLWAAATRLCGRPRMRWLTAEESIYLTQDDGSIEH